MRNPTTLIPAICLLVSLGCSDSREWPPSPPVPVRNYNLRTLDLVQNGSFEFNGHPSLQGWLVDSDTSNVSFSADAPPHGGDYSLSLNCDWIYAGYVESGMGVPAGKVILRFSVWGKAIRGQGWEAGAFALLYFKRGGILSGINGIFVTDSSWTFGSVTDTLNTLPGDSVVVALAGDEGQFAGGRALFDLCRLEVLR